MFQKGRELLEVTVERRKEKLSLKERLLSRLEKLKKA